jgi:hypothetical protein
MSSEDKKHRSHLPIPTPERTGLITYDAKDPDTCFPPIEQLRPPKGAPNVLLILIDDADSVRRAPLAALVRHPMRKTWPLAG